MNVDMITYVLQSIKMKPTISTIHKRKPKNCIHMSNEFVKLKKLLKGIYMNGTFARLRLKIPPKVWRFDSGLQVKI
ncbi:hypothetical protein DYY65_07475 [Nitrososphaera sp. AFS]|nr:hypothetical protein [Nitrososphaera sp. AFS]